jgi:hypothetical protein
MFTLPARKQHPFQTKRNGGKPLAAPLVGWRAGGNSGFKYKKHSQVYKPFSF